MKVPQQVFDQFAKEGDMWSLTHVLLEAGSNPQHLLRLFYRAASVPIYESLSTSRQPNSSYDVPSKEQILERTLCQNSLLSPLVPRRQPSPTLGMVNFLIDGIPGEKDTLNIFLTVLLQPPSFACKALPMVPKSRQGKYG